MVSEYNHKASTVRRGWPTRGCRAMQKGYTYKKKMPTAEY